MPKERIINNQIKVNYNDDYIFRYTFLPKSNVDMESAQQMVQTGDEWSNGLEKSCNLVDTREMIFISSKVRKYLAGQKRDQLRGIAIVINSKFQSGLANLYMKFSKPTTPTKIFDDLKEAEVWLKSLLH